MIKKGLLLALIYILTIFAVSGQSIDNNIKAKKKDKTFLKKTILPVSLIVSDLLIYESAFEKNL